MDIEIPLDSESDSDLSSFDPDVTPVPPNRRLEVPQLRSSLPIIRPPKGCDKSTKPNDLQYQDLPTPTSIRLLKLFPGSPGFSESDWNRPPIKCSIIIADLNDDPPYDALSYTWGDPCTLYLNPDDMSSDEEWRARPFNVEVDGKVVSVGTNLYTALLAIRTQVTHPDHPAFKDVPRTTGCFWIDALCINQNDTNEKSSQVMMMSRIFRQASVVFAWLGGGDGLSRQAIHDLGTIADLCLGENSPKPEDLRPLDIESDETYQKLGIPKIGYSSWIGIYLFLNRTWFKRAWIAQEITLARQPWFICARQWFNWLTIMRSFINLHQSRWFSQMRNLAEPLIRNHRNPHELRSSAHLASTNVRLYRPRQTNQTNSNLGLIIEDIRVGWGTSQGRRQDGRSPVRPTLRRLLEIYRSAEAGDPRDKVYAFLGMSREQETNPLQVDYSLTTEQVYVQTAKHILVSSGTLRLLSLNKHELRTRSTLRLPSWVPDFTAQNLTPGINQEEYFTASLGLGRCNVEYLESDACRLRFSGVKVATVRRSCCFSWQRIRDLRRLLRGVSPARAPAGQSVFETLWRTLLRDCYEGEGGAPPECAGLFLEVMDKVIGRHQVRVASCLSAQLEERRRSGQSAVTLPAEEEDSAENHDRKSGLDVARERLGLVYTALQEILGRHSAENGIIFPPEYAEFGDRLRAAVNEREESKFIEGFILKVKRRGLATENSEFRYQVIGSTGGRLLFTTDEGHLGLGSNVLRVGDEVWVLTGGDVPFLLRPTNRADGEFLLVGEAYVHGIMHGEAAADIPSGGLKKVVLV